MSAGRERGDVLVVVVDGYDDDGGGLVDDDCDGDDDDQEEENDEEKMEDDRGVKEDEKAEGQRREPKTRWEYTERPDIRTMVG